MAGGQLPFGFAPQGELTAYEPTLREKAADWLRLKLFTDDRAGQEKADRLVNVGETMLPPFGFATGMYDAGREGAKGNYLTAGAMGAMAVLPGGSKKGIKAYHGSPHSFDKFSMDKIGTGEGAQAYGHGLYFAENEGVAQGYKNALAPGMGDGALRAAGIGDAELRSMRQFTQSAVDPDIALRDWLAWTKTPETPEIKAAFMQEWNAKNPGSMYEVNIDADPNAFLDWDKPLSEQSEAIKNAFRSINIADESVWPNITASDAYEMLRVDSMGDDAFLRDQAYRLARRSDAGAGASGMLRETGIPGIKFLDAGSRYTPANLPNNPIANEARQFLAAAQGDSAKALQMFKDSNPVERFAEPERDEIAKVIKAAAKPATRNYVVFDDNLINIIKKYGIAGLLGAGGMYGMSGDEAQAGAR